MRNRFHKQTMLCFITCLLFAAAADAQNAPIPVTIGEPQSNFHTGSVMPVGLSVPARMMNGPRVPSADKQIRVNIRYVLLDSETRKRIYRDLGVERLETVGSQVPNLQANYEAMDSADTQGTELIAKSSRVTTAILNFEDMKRIMKAVASSPDSQITRAPSIVLIDGQDTEVTDLVQRPFVVDLQRHTDGGKPAVNSVVQVLNEGITIRINASLTPSERVHVASDIVFEKLLHIETEEVFGISNDATSVQVPVQQRKSIRATENLQVGQTLLVDPYVKNERMKAESTKVPILSRIPLISDSFTNTEMVAIQQHMIILIEPLLEAPATPSLPH